jgi:hypothetical protein
MRQIMLLLAFLMTATFIAAGCGEKEVKHEVIVKQPPQPPPARIEERGEAPAPNYAWIPGNWEWNGQDWDWVPGRWVQPPYTQAAWVPSHWEWNGKDWVWVTGHWEK